MSIEKDFSDGDKFEEYVLGKVREKYPDATKTEGYFPDYDINIPSKETLECKFDRLSKTTGNVAIEYQYNGKPSGIDHSKATMWVIGYWNDRWKYAYVPVEELKKACKKCKTVSGGDRMSSRMYLLPVSQLETIEGVHTRVV